MAKLVHGLPRICVLLFENDAKGNICMHNGIIDRLRCNVLFTNAYVYLEHFQNCNIFHWCMIFDLAMKQARMCVYDHYEVEK